MKKKNIIIIALIIVLLVIITYMLVDNTKKQELETYKSFGENEEKFRKKQEEFYQKLNERTFDKVSIVIKENTLTKTGATIIIKDENEIPYSFGNDYKLEKNIFGLWFGLPLKSGYSTDGLYGHGTNGITEMEIDWKDRYGELKKRKI